MDWDFHIGLISLTVQVLQWHSLQIGTDGTVQSVSLSGEHCGRLDNVSQSVCQSVSQMNTVVARLDDVS